MTRTWTPQRDLELRRQPFVLAVHRGVRSCLNFVDPRHHAGAVVGRAGTAAHARDGNALGFDHPPGIDGLLHGGLCPPGPLGAIDHVDQVPLVGLQTRKRNAGQGGQAPRKFDGRFARSDTAAPHADIDFDQQMDDRSDRGGGPGNGNRLLPVIDRDTDLRPLGQPREPGGFRFADDLVGNQHVVEAVFDQYFGFSQLRRRSCRSPRRQFAVLPA